MPLAKYSLFLMLLCWSTVGSACFAGALPPSRTDVGTTVLKPNGDASSGIRFSTGAHWASAAHSANEDYDVGAGYVYERVEKPGGDITSKHVSGEDQSASVSQGAYLAVDRVLHRDKRNNQRTWLGMRGEYLHASEEDGGPSLNALARLNWEVFGQVEGAGSTDTNCGAAVGFAYGTMGLGFYAEAGARRSLKGVASFSATLGLSVRLPFLGAFGFDLCPN